MLFLNVFVNFNIQNNNIFPYQKNAIDRPFINIDERQIAVGKRTIQR